MTPLAFVARFFVAGFFAPRPFDVVDGLFADRALGVLAIPIILPIADSTAPGTH